VDNGAAKEIGMAVVSAITKSRGMEVAGAVDSYLVGEDIGKVCGMEEALEIPIINDLTMVLGSISQTDVLFAAAVAAMNSDSQDDNAIVACFCVLQLIGKSP
ncbi:dihydrodipicolinate reductase-like protein CRR1, chloroplastic isoform X1, partial [Tanacetum coccineum]